MRMTIAPNATGEYKENREPSGACAGRSYTGRHEIKQNRDK
jgi:hypothetical protein